MISLSDQIAEVQREIAMRKIVYPKIAAAGASVGKVRNAILQMERIEAVLATLQWLHRNEAAIKGVAEK